MATDNRIDRTYIAERNKRILELYERGTMTYEQIAQHFGLSRGFIKLLTQPRTRLTTTTSNALWARGIDQQTQKL